jgi:pilus assembly protein CpaE
MVAMLDTFSLKDTKLGLETLDLMGYDRGAVRIVLNRADTSVGISDDDVKAILGSEPAVRVPSDRMIPRSLTDGIPIVSSSPRSQSSKAFRELAAGYVTNGRVSLMTDEPSRRKRRSNLRRA